MQSEAGSELEALEVVLNDEAIFTQVVQTVYTQMDTSGNGQLESKEMLAFLNNFCEATGAAPPTSFQVDTVYQHLDLNGDGGISLEELAVFLRHFLTEQMQQAKGKLTQLGVKPPEQQSNAASRSTAKRATGSRPMSTARQ